MLVINRLLLILIVGLGLSLSFLPGILKATPAFTLGNEAYQNKDFTQAIKLYEESLKTSQSAAQHFNLANAYYENKEYGRAILHYEKAWTLDHTNYEVLNNLQKAYDAIGKKDESVGDRWGPPTAWTFTMIAIVTVLLGFISFCLLLYVFPKNPFLKIVLWICILLSIFLIGVNFLYSTQTRLGIVFNNEVPLRISPTHGSPITTVLSEGTKAKVIKTKDKPDGWFLIKTPDNKEGWISTEDFGLIWE